MRKALYRSRKPDNVRRKYAEKDKERKKNSRSRKPDDVKEKDAEKDKERKASSRSRKPDDVKERDAEKDKERKASSRSKKPDDVKRIEAEKERKRLASLRHKQTDSTKVDEKQKDKERKTSSRTRKPDYVKEKDAEKDKERKASSRSRKPDDVKERDAEKDKERKVSSRSRKPDDVKERDAEKDKERKASSRSRKPDDAGIIPLKLKRKIQYKSHVTYENIRPNVVLSALEMLKQINKFYKDSQENVEWEKQCMEEDEEMWKELVLEEKERSTNDVPAGVDSSHFADELPVLSTSTMDIDDENDGDNPIYQSNECDKRDSEQTEAEDEDPRDQLRGVNFDTCIQPTDPAMNSDGIFSIAPGEGKKPISIMMDEHCEEQAFPTLFPTGEFGFTVDRTIKLSPKKYFNARLLNKDARFAQNIEYLFFAQFVTEYKQVMDNISIALRKVRLSRDDSEHVTAGIVNDSEKLNRIIFRDKAYNMLQTVRGSPPYWQGVMYKILAAVKQLGMFTWFLTLSAADLRWTDTLQVIALQQGRTLTDEDISKMTWEEKCKLLASNPVTAARHFDHRLQCFFRDVILSDLQPLGKVTNHMIRIEFQGRGSPHAHCVLWVENAPSHEDTEENISRFIDKYVTCQLPPSEDDELMHSLVSTLQRHSHSASCRKTGKNCRFQYPRPIAPVTVVADTPSTEDLNIRKQIVEASAETMNKVKNALDETTEEGLSVQDVLSDVNTSEDEYLDALRVNSNGKSIMYARTPQETNINTYNPTLLKAWQANMDIQYVCNPYACIHYIVSYITKDEREMGLALREVSKAFRDADIKKRMKHIASCFLNVREVSAQETVYRVLGLPLYRSTFQTVFIQTDLPENRVVFLKPKCVLQGMDADSEDVYAQTFSQKYEHRPTELEQLTLAEFARWYVPSYKTDDMETENDFQPNQLKESSTSKQTIKLTDKKGYMKKRNKPCIVRYHKFSENQEEERYCHHMLMLYLPWRNEETDLKNNHLTYADHYHTISDQIESKRSALESFTEIIENALERHEEEGPPVHAWDTLDTGTQQENAEVNEEQCQIHPEYSFLQPSSEHTDTDIKESEICASLPLAVECRPEYLIDEIYRSKVQSLNQEQRKVFDYMQNWCTDIMKSGKTTCKAKAIHLFVTGGAGTGKSHLILAIHQMALRTLQREGTNPDAHRVLLTAPTGTAAFNIHGSTLHSLFLLPLGQTKGYKKLSDEKRNTLRCKLQDLEILIIDEISMVGCDMLMTIDQRLREIKGTDIIFGGITVLAFGDLYQLAPVCQRFVFQEVKDLFARLAGSLWQDNFMIAELTEIMRQKDDKEFAELLNRIREGVHTEDDVANLQQCCISSEDKIDLSDALHVYSTNAKVDAYNEDKLAHLKGRIRKCVAIDRKPNTLKGHEMNKDSRFTGGLPAVLELKIGARVMLIRNIDVNDGLVNGALGTIVSFNEFNPSVTSPKEVLVQFDNPRVGAMAGEKTSMNKAQHPTAVPIGVIEAKFSISARNPGLEIKRQQFPLRLSWATTIHKVQGLTVKDIVVSMEGKFNDGQCYVALSRVPKMSGLHLLQLTPSKIKASRAVTKELMRMSNEMSFQFFHDEIETALKDPCQTQVIAVHNIRSLPAHYDDLKGLPFLDKCTAVCLTETWLQSHHTASTYNLPSYHQLRRDRSNTEKGGGLCMYISSSVRYQTLDSSRDKPGMEIQSIILHPVNSSPFHLVTVYRNPKSSLVEFSDRFSLLLRSVGATEIPAIIVGDFNLNLLKDQHSMAVQHELQHYGFQQCITKPTHVSGSLLDHVYSNTPCTTWQTASYYSDHDVIWIAV
ncbi:uncharacterized protein LOC105444942 [Strongylocentrotus purpuratus]|uniref:ATP-dependent DNA helicase n=1 Tax=Strongylocentrotus purpuratus TaxID=7668 RepID=A0A7M7PC21_STRPU|nr:uncharacterized protein LOC105444942 [Strongylocentrotus purpuratus]